MSPVQRRNFIRRVALALSIPLVAFAALPAPSLAVSLGLPSSDYPRGTQIVVQPATNAQADVLFRNAHHSSFERLHRIDGVGWLQAAVWHFSTGRGAATQKHQTIFGYGINIFKTAQAASRALNDVKIVRTSYTVAHLPAQRFISSDARETLDFVFFAYRDVEIEAYYEYTGVAPKSLAKKLHHLFSKQNSHLAHLARVYSRLMHQVPTATATLVPSPTATPMLTATSPTNTPSPTPKPSATSSPTPTASPATTPAATATVTSTPTPAATNTATPPPRYLSSGDDD